MRMYGKRDTVLLRRCSLNFLGLHKTVAITKEVVCDGQENKDELNHVS